ncbi:hypothetical protein C8R44DRAFT_809153 [Mycena epipterygia]|nr:hypothetical protein C8R44DRAFT_809153 [Mycena epipterygia]
MTEDELICASDKTTHPPRSTAAPVPAKRRRAPERHRRHLRRRGPRQAARSRPRRRRILRAYSTAELRTFHCVRARKMPLLGLNPVCNQTTATSSFQAYPTRTPRLIRTQPRPPRVPATKTLVSPPIPPHSFSGSYNPYGSKSRSSMDQVVRYTAK